MYQLAAFVSAEIEIRKSRFIGQLYPVLTRSEAKEKLAELRVLHPNAVHICWVLICEGDSGMDDDGEPSGTAARPMYNVLVHKELTNVLAVVVRYWGGIKLGAGGLARAYGQAISDASKCAELIAVEAMCQRSFAVQFADESQLRHLCDQFSVQVVSVDYADDVTVHMQLKLGRAAEFEQCAFDLLRGSLRNVTVNAV